MIIDNYTGRTPFYGFKVAFWFVDYFVYLCSVAAKVGFASVILKYIWYSPRLALPLQRKLRNP